MMEKKRLRHVLGYLVLTTALLGGTLLGTDGQRRAPSESATHPDQQAHDTARRVFPVRAAFY